jgi:hypothetical protein
MMVPPRILLRMRNVSDKVVEKKKTHNLSSIFFFENGHFYMIMYKITVDPDSSQMTIQYVACALHGG